MFLLYTYFLHDAYTTLTCTTYNTYILVSSIIIVIYVL